MLDSDLSMSVKRDETITTEACGLSTGTSASAGGSLALGLQETSLVLQRDVAAKMVGLLALVRLVADTRAITAAADSKAKAAGGMVANRQAASATDFATSQNDEAVAAPSTQTPQGGVSIAAALALSVQKSGTQATINARGHRQCGARLRCRRGRIWTHQRWPMGLW